MHLHCAAFTWPFFLINSLNEDAAPPAEGAEKDIYEECTAILTRGAETLQKIKGYQACDDAIRKVRSIVRKDARVDLYLAFKSSANFCEISPICGVFFLFRVSVSGADVRVVGVLLCDCVV